MGKTNRFRVKKYDEDKNKIVVEEERKYHNPFILFLIDNGRLIFTISLLLSVTVFIIAITLAFGNMKESSIVMYESNGVIVSFDGTDNSIINGTPITEEYADKVFSNHLTDENYSRGVVILLKKGSLSNGEIFFYSDKTAVIKYDDGSYKRVFSIDGNYGVDENGNINAKAVFKDLSGDVRKNSKLNIDIIYLSDGSVIVQKDDVNFLVRNSDITSNDLFYSNLSGCGVVTSRSDNKIYYSDGTIKEDDYIIVDGIKRLYDRKIGIHNDSIKVIYYDNGYAEVIYGDMSIIVRNSEHIKYDENIFEIIDNSNDNMIDIKDIMNIKNIELKNTNNEKVKYMIVLEETDDYSKHDVKKRLSNNLIRYNIYVNGKMIKNNVLDNRINDRTGLNCKGNCYLIYEDSIERLSLTAVKIGMWIDYFDAQNDDMNSAFIGTMKVYVES